MYSIPWCVINPARRLGLNLVINLVFMRPKSIGAMSEFLLLPEGHKIFAAPWRRTVVTVAGNGKHLGSSGTKLPFQKSRCSPSVDPRTIVDPAILDTSDSPHFA